VTDTARSSTVANVDEDTGTPIPVGNVPFGVAITPNGTTAYVTNGDDNTVTPITIATIDPPTPAPDPAPGPPTPTTGPAVARHAHGGGLLW
jgi:DNA-binding beta-propeller fold protein YncE